MTFRWPSCKTSRERMCPGVLSRGVRVARWTQIDAIARADMPWRPVEWRLLCQMNCRKVWDRALTALRGSSMSVRRVSCKTSRERMCPGAMSRGVRGARWTQIDAIARVNVPWRALEGRLPCQMNCRNVRDWAQSDYRIPSDPGSAVGPCQMNCRKFQYWT